MSERLAIVMPVYNEEESVGKVFDEWLPALDGTLANYTIFAIDDGSKDRTLEILKTYEATYPQKVKAIHHTNRGHGQTCVAGYKLAIEKGFDYILQIDSDGQCDPQYFSSFWTLRDDCPIFGYRVTRDDGWQRWWISRVVSLVGFIGSGTWVKDANVPYRLIRTSQLEKLLENIPADFHLANILVCIKLKQNYNIRWVNIHFRERIGGSPSIKTFSFAEQGLKLLKQLISS